MLFNLNCEVDRLLNAIQVSMELINFVSSYSHQCIVDIYLFQNHGLVGKVSKTFFSTVMLQLRQLNDQLNIY